MHSPRKFAFLALVLCGACRAPEANSPIAFERLTTEPRAFGKKTDAPQQVVARSFTEWQGFCGSDERSRDLAREIDWSKRMLILVSLGSRPSGGYTVQIDSIVQDGSSWVVHARETRPAPGSYQTMMLTTPFDCVAVPRFDGRVEFSFE